jgi:hypothetical protein
MHYYILIISSPLWFMAGRLVYKQVTFFLNSVPASGQLCGWKENVSGYRTHWYPIVSFIASDGATHEAIGNSGFSPKPRYEIGHPFPVRYNPLEPEKAQIFTIMHFCAAPLAFVLLASAMTFVFLKNAKLLS